jgi:uncharacterized RDD family membrane protein YckC
MSKSAANQAQSKHPEPLVSAGPVRRLGAMVYDTLIVIAIEIVATVPFLPFMRDGHVLVASDVGVLAYIYRAWQLLVFVVFFVFFWTRKGQTLGMRAWRLYIQRIDGPLPTRRDAIMRLLWSTVPWLPAYAVLAAADNFGPRKVLLAIGSSLLTLVLVNYCIAWFDPERRSWHDRFLQTRIVRR